MPFIILFIFCSILSAQTHSPHIQALISQAHALNLADSKQWRDLLHIRHNKSEITSPYFFLSEHFADSQNIAKDELEATIIAFYADIAEITIPEAIFKRRKAQIDEYQKHHITLPTRSIHPADYHALCRFPARLAFLKEHLDLSNFPEIKCEEFNAMKNYIMPTKVSIVFPAAYINSPASSFGHTFLLLDSIYQSRLLAFAINYQANVNQNDENALLFAFRGLLGFYTGSYSILPYYEKIKEYSASENRDMWEYELNLTGEEITRLYAHIWELSDAFSPYYFF